MSENETIKQAIAEGLSEATVNSAGQQPYAYLVLIFAAFVVAAVLVFLVRLIVWLDKKEAARLKTTQAMQNACHLQAQEHLKIGVEAAAKCESALHNNTTVLERVVQQLGAIGP